MANAQQSNRLIKKISGKLTITIVTVVAITAGILIFQVQRSNDDKNSNDATASSKIIGKVAAHYLVPTDETPTVARIQDKDQLKEGQDFYSGSQNGDYVLVYTKAKLAILYREVGDKLVKVRLIRSDTPATTP